MNHKTFQGLSIFIVMLLIGLPLVHAMDLTYDANGNLVTGDGKFREYNSFNQLWKVYNGSSDSDPLLQEYVYHPTEERVWLKKTFNTDSSVKETIYYWNKNFVTVVNSSGEYNYTYVYHEGQLVGQELNGVKHFIHTDHLGSATVVTNASGSIVENTTYDPFGQVISGGEASRFGYEGKEHDTVVGDTDFNFRKYDPDLHIFTQPDTLIQNVYDPQALNRYAFERNNPYKYVDEDGHELVTAGVILFAGTFGLGVLQEIAIQGIYAGEIYDSGKIFGSGFNAVLDVGFSVITLGYGSPIAFAHAMNSMGNSINEAKQHKLMKEQEERREQERLKEVQANNPPPVYGAADNQQNYDSSSTGGVDIFNSGIGSYFLNNQGSGTFFNNGQLVTITKGTVTSSKTIGTHKRMCTYCDRYKSENE